MPNLMRTEWEYRLTAGSRGTHLVQVSHARREYQVSLERMKALLEAESMVASRVGGR